MAELRQATKQRAVSIAHRARRTASDLAPHPGRTSMSIEESALYWSLCSAARKIKLVAEDSGYAGKGTWGQLAQFRLTLDRLENALDRLEGP